MEYIKDLVTVVVPVFNVEKYLDECIKSIIAQTYVNIEVLLIDDGSQDKSYEICKKYQNIDRRVSAFQKENGGVTSARKYGFHRAHGEFIVFFDSDDIVSSTYIEEQLNNIKETEGDMSICGYYVWNGTSEDEWMIKHSVKKYYKDSFLRELILPIIWPFDSDDSYIPGFLWMRLMKTNFVSDDCFYSDRQVCTEDVLFIIEYLKNCASVSILDKPLYYYCIRSDSLTHKHRDNRINLEIQRIHFLRNALIFYGAIDENRLALSAFRGVCGCINNAWYLADFHAFKNEVQVLLSLEEVMQILLNTPVKYLSFSEKMRYVGCRMKLYRMLYYIESKMNKILG